MVLTHSNLRLTCELPTIHFIQPLKGGSDSGNVLISPPLCGEICSFTFHTDAELETAHQVGNASDRCQAQELASRLANAASELGVKEDIELHVAIARASRNQMFVQTLDALAVHVFNGMNVTRSLSLTRSQKRLRLVQEEHRRIIEAIFASDGELSRSAMREHIDNARHRALGDSVEPEED